LLDLVDDSDFHKEVVADRSLNRGEMTVSYYTFRLTVSA